MVEKRSYSGAVSGKGTGVSGSTSPERVPRGFMYEPTQVKRPMYFVLHEALQEQLAATKSAVQHMTQKLKAPHQREDHRASAQAAQEKKKKKKKKKKK